MADKQSGCTKTVSVLANSGLSSKSVTDVIVTIHGNTTAIEIVYSGGSQFIKVRQGVVDVGGDINFGTGTKVSA